MENQALLIQKSEVSGSHKMVDLHSSMRAETYIYFTKRLVIVNYPDSNGSLFRGHVAALTLHLQLP